MGRRRLCVNGNFVQEKIKKKNGCSLVGVYHFFQGRGVATESIPVHLLIFRPLKVEIRRLRPRLTSRYHRLASRPSTGDGACRGQSFFCEDSSRRPASLPGGHPCGRFPGIHIRWSADHCLLSSWRLSRGMAASKGHVRHHILPHHLFSLPSSACHNHPLDGNDSTRIR